jgi:putative ABC transport system permease protein
MSTLPLTLRSSLRVLTRNRGFALTAILTLAFGIGSATVVFSMVSAFLLRPLPFPDSSALVHLWATDTSQGWDEVKVSLQNFLDWRRGTTTLEGLEGFYYRSYNLSGDATPQQIEGGNVTAGTFRLLGVPPQLGRDFRDGEDQPGREPVAILSNGVWRSRFGGRRDVVGQRIRLDGEPYTIIGVMPLGFEFPLKKTQVWVPLVLNESRHTRSEPLLQAVGRLKPGKTLEETQAEMAAVTARLRQGFPTENANLGVRVVPLHQALLFSYDTIRLVLVGVAAAVVFVLLIVCANVANLSLARAVTRTREIAIRTALGASRGDLLRLCLAESGVLTALGGALGLLLAVWCDHLLDAVFPANLYRVGHISVDRWVALLLLGVFTLATLMIGSIPFLQLSRIDPVHHLRESAKTTYGRRQKLLRNGLVVGQVAAALFLLIGASLVFESLLRLRNVDSGLSPERVGVLNVSLSGARYPGSAEKQVFYREILRKVSALPGIQGAALVYPLPLNFESDNLSFTIYDDASAGASKPHTSTAFWASPDYFRVLGIPLRQGRFFGDLDMASSAPVVIVNHKFADRFWPGQDPVGKLLELEPGGSQAKKASVVGVVGDSRDTNLSKLEPELFVPILQKPLRSFRLVVRAAGDPLASMPQIKQAIWALDPDLALLEGRKMQDVLANSTTPQRIAAVLLAILGLSALSLAVIGLYGIMSFLSRQRVHEIGIRMALGARREEVLTFLLRQGMVLALIGTLVGLAGGILLGRLLSSVLYGVGAFSLAAFIGFPLLLLCVALVATLVPARRATRVDPVVALRQD